MKIMLDFITVRLKTGAAEYVRRVVYSLIDELKRDAQADVELYAVYNSVMPIAYEDLREPMLTKVWPVRFVDCKGTTIGALAQDLGIDCLFIGCAQYAGEVLGAPKCRTICVLHDVYDEEVLENNLLEIGRLSWHTTTNYLLNTIYLFAHIAVDRLRHSKVRNSRDTRMQSVVKMLTNNLDSHLVVVSDYTRSVAQYHWNLPDDRVKVLWSPERVFNSVDNAIANIDLKNLIDEGRRYFLLLGGNRMLKNTYKAIEAFRRYVQFDPNCYLVVIGGRYGGENGRVIGLPYLSDNELCLAMSHCYALIYPTYFEGFGYPPIEAMHYGKPVLSSNATSIPEILGGGGGQYISAPSIHQQFLGQ